MTNNSENNTEKSKVGLMELLREVLKKLKHELIVLAFGLVILVTYVALSSREFSASIAFTFIMLYAITIGAYLVLKTRTIDSQLKEASKEYIRYGIGYPVAFPNPHKVSKKRPELAVVHFALTFEVENHMKEIMMFRVYVCSPTQAVGFAWESPRKVWRRQFGIIPHREEVDFALDDAEYRSISPEQKEKIAFQGLYRPRFAYTDFSHRGKIVLTFRRSGREQNPFATSFVDTHIKKIYIPFKDEVKYKSESDAASRE